MTHVKRITPIVELNTLKTSMLNSSLRDYSDAYIHANKVLAIINNNNNNNNNSNNNNNNNSVSFKFKEKITGKTRNDGTKDV